MTQPTPEQVRAWISESLERSPCGATLEGVAQDISEGHARLWVGEASAVVTQPVFTERVWHAGGNMADLIKQMRRASDVLKEQGFERLTIEQTRKGWTKVLRPYGFRPFQGLEYDL